MPLVAADARPAAVVATADLAGATPWLVDGAHRLFEYVVGESPGSHLCAPSVPKLSLEALEVSLIACGYL